MKSSKKATPARKPRVTRTKTGRKRRLVLKVDTKDRRRRTARASIRKHAKPVALKKNATLVSSELCDDLMSQTNGKRKPFGLATRWKPGQTGNPGGRPSLKKIYENMAEQMMAEERTYEIDGEEVTMSRGDRVMDAVIRKAEHGNLSAAKLLWDRIYPAVQLSRTQRTNVNVPPGEVLQVLAGLRESTDDNVAALPAEVVYDDAVSVR